MSAPSTPPAATTTGIPIRNFRYLIPLAFAGFCFLALLSYDNRDLLILDGGGPATTPILQNWLGYAGARISRALLLAFGFSSLLVAPLAALAAFRRFTGGPHVRPLGWDYPIAFGLLTLGLCMAFSSWPDLLAPAADHFNIARTTGGVLGQRLCDPERGWMKLVLNPVGNNLVGAALVGIGLWVIWLYDWHGLARAAWRQRQARRLAGPPTDRIQVPDAPAIRKLPPRRPPPPADAELPIFTPADPPTATANPARPAPPPRPGGPYALPGVELLNPHQDRETAADPAEVEEKKQIIQQTLDSFSIDARVGDATCGPRVTLFEIAPAPGVRVERIASYASNFTMNLSAESLRVLAPIPGRNTVGIEVPNSKAAIVSLRGIMETPAWRDTQAALPLLLGRNIAGGVVVTDLARAPHLLIAGATGSGKSVCINALIVSLLMRFTPDELRLMLVDPKVVELCAYQPLPHLITPVISDVTKVPLALNWAIREMERRYQLLAKAGARNLESFNNRQPTPEPILDDGGNPIPQRLPFIVIILDELADIMMTAKGDVENALARIAQKSRAVGIHTIVATQRPSVDVITGVIKANFPTRIAFQVTSYIDSRTILDGKGAETLLGRGDMLFRPPGAAKLERIQSAYVADPEIERIVAACAAQAPQQFEPDVFKAPASGGAGGAGGETLDAGDEALIEQAIEVILRDKRATTSYVQRRLGIGYNKAATLMEILEQRGVVGPQIGAAPREILLETPPPGGGGKPASPRTPAATTPDPFADDDPYAPPVEDDAGPWKDT
ncbi:MAG: DNA translocase FtsK 4TM domain-containing protein [Lentisphaeria bacterium]|jgi:S-DNA-T family DNA segregation ATPase FtsK/SpoIIIE